jgi:hypothetical protein
MSSRQFSNSNLTSASANFEYHQSLNTSFSTATKNTFCLLQNSHNSSLASYVDFHQQRYANNYNYSSGSGGFRSRMMRLDDSSESSESAEDSYPQSQMGIKGYGSIIGNTSKFWSSSSKLNRSSLSRELMRGFLNLNS